MLLLLIISIQSSLFSQNIINQKSINVFNDSLIFLSNEMPRQEGSKEEQKVFSYLEDFFTSRNFKYECQNLVDIEDSHSFSKNMIVRIPGKIRDQFILAAPLDSYDKSNAKSLNIAILLAFMNEYQTEVPPVSLVFLFTSGDRVERKFLGSREYLYNYPFKNSSALLYFLLKKDGEIPEIFGSTVRKNAPGWLMEDIRTSFEKTGMETRIDSTALLLNRAGLSTRNLPISQYLEEDIPSAALISSGFSGPEISMNGKQYIQFLHRLINHYEKGLPKDWENNYIYLGRNRTILLYLSENSLILFYILLISLAMILPLFQERKIYLNYRKFRSQLWTVPIVIYLSFTFFMISTLMLEELIQILSHGAIWQEYPLYFFILKITSVLFLSTLFINVLRGLPFPKNPHFYSYFAFIISFLNLIIVSVYSISFSPFMLISLVFVFLFVTSRSKGSKRFFMLLSFIPQFSVLLFLFSRDYNSVYELALLSRVKGNWILTVMALPLICMISSLGFYHHHYNKSRQEMKTALMTLFLAFTMVLMIYFSYQLKPFSSRFKQQLILEDKIDMDTRLREVTLKSSGKIGDGTLMINNKALPLTQIGNELRVQGEIDGHPLVLSWSVDEFLDRRLIDLTISAEKDPDEIKIFIVSKDPIVLYDCPFPYEIQPDLKSAQIFIGINPPMPLNIPLIFSKSSKPSLSIKLLYNDSNYKVNLKNSLIEKKSQTVIKKTLSYSEIMEPKQLIQ